MCLLLCAVNCEPSMEKSFVFCCVNGCNFDGDLAGVLSLMKTPANHHKTNEPLKNGGAILVSCITMFFSWR